MAFYVYYTVCEFKKVSHVFASCLSMIIVYMTISISPMDKRSDSFDTGLAVVILGSWLS